MTEPSTSSYPTTSDLLATYTQVALRLNDFTPRHSDVFLERGKLRQSLVEKAQVKAGAIPEDLLARYTIKGPLTPAVFIKAKS